MRYTNVYISDANEREGHQVKPVKLPEAVQFDGIIFLHGAYEGLSEHIKFRWDTKVDSFN